MPKQKESESLKEYQTEDIDERGRKIIKTDFGDQSEMPRVMVVYTKTPNMEPVPMKKIVAETLENRGEVKIVKGVAPARPTVAEAKETAEAQRKAREALTK
jgi:hypothetical protein